MNGTYYISAEKMTVGYDGRPLIENVSIGVRRGEILTLIGPNGSGKSTILKSMIRQLKLIAGTVVLDGRDMAALKEREIAKKLAIVMTERIRGELMTCRDVVETGRYPYTGRLGILTKEDKAVVAEALETVHASDFADRPYNAISDGQRQRILLARAIAQEPEVIVLDEPTSFLDVKHKLELLDILKTMVRERNVAVIVSLHELDLAEKISDRVVCVADGRIDRCDVPENVFRDDYIASLYGIRTGRFNALFGSPELPAVEGEPQVFLICGGGSGVPVCRALQRAGVPFAAGILPESDLDYPVAQALSAELYAIPAFSTASEAGTEAVRARMLEIGRVISTVPAFGETNASNRVLFEAAKAAGILVSAEEFLRGSDA
ncbi:MAG: ABC transporter ATP-binding protein [Clostridia bacterium]|nr:ABC transporter ATP-binding protein [Clostridia bacterium]